MNNVLVVTDVGPTNSFAGGLVLSQIVGSLPKEYDIDFLLVHNPTMGNYFINMYQTKSKIFRIRKPQEYWYRIWHSWIGEFLSGIDAEAIYSKIDRIMAQDRYTDLIFVIQGQTMIRVAEKFSVRPVRRTYIHWDPWNWWAETSKVNALTKARIQMIESGLGSQGFHLVPSRNYIDYISATSNNSSPIYPVMPHVAFQTKASDSVRIVMVGQLYAQKELWQFLDFLDANLWSFGDREVSFDYFGGGLIEHPKISHRGWIDPSMLSQALNNYDYGFLPYPTANSTKSVGLNSFPSKVSNYLSSGLPIIYAGSKLSPVFGIIKSASIYFDLKSDNEKNAITFSMGIENWTSLARAARGTYQDYFSEEAFNKSLTPWFKFLQIDEAPNFSYSFFPEVTPIESSAEITGMLPLSVAYLRILKICDLSQFSHNLKTIISIAFNLSIKPSAIRQIVNRAQTFLTMVVRVSNLTVYLLKWFIFKSKSK
jgi:hypothetical protein